MNLSVGIDEGELQRQKPSGGRLVAAAHRLAERGVGRKYWRLIGRDRLRLGLRLGQCESRDEHAGNDRKKAAPTHDRLHTDRCGR